MGLLHAFQEIEYWTLPVVLSNGSTLSDHYDSQHFQTLSGRSKGQGEQKTITLRNNFQLEYSHNLSNTFISLIFLLLCPWYLTEETKEGAATVMITYFLSQRWYVLLTYRSKMPGEINTYITCWLWIHCYTLRLKCFYVFVFSAS